MFLYLIFKDYYVYIYVYYFKVFFQLNSVMTCYVCVQLIKFIYIYIYLYMFCVEWSFIKRYIPTSRIIWTCWIQVYSDYHLNSIYIYYCYFWLFVFCYVIMYAICVYCKFMCIRRCMYMCALYTEDTQIDKVTVYLVILTTAI